MNLIRILIIIFALTSIHKETYSQSLADKDETQALQDTLFDIEKSQRIISTADSTWMDSYERKIPKTRIIFKKGRIFRYSAVYIGSSNDTLSNNFVNVEATGTRWNEQPEVQDLILYEFPNYQTDSIELYYNQINREHQNWTPHSATGVIENTEQVWMHPIRENQYKFTQVAPFPNVLFPLQKGKKWKTTLNIHKGWGEWNGNLVKTKYKVAGQKPFKINELEINCWIIESVSKYTSGNSRLTTLFNEQYGFVKMEYINHRDEKLIFKLVSINE